jgi:uncharacterized membrane protein YczE
MMEIANNKRLGKLSELSYVFGIVLIALGVAFMTKASFGVSSIVAPAYILHLKMTALGHTWCTFGTAEYMLQGALLILMCLIVRGFKWKYLLSFLTSVIYGLILDGWFLILGTEPLEGIAARIISLSVGIVISSAAIAFLFRTYLPQQVYELFVKEVSERYSISIKTFKLTFDLSMLALAVVLSLALGLPLYAGIGVGTVICALINSPLIAMIGGVYDKCLGFEPKFPRVKAFLK